jgi:glycosyltransferase involved in cell wall biosynthesis
MSMIINPVAYSPPENDHNRASDDGNAVLNASAGGSASKLSIVVCSYNQADFIGETLESLINQQSLSPGELEIIVIDGGSTDGSVEIIQRYALHFAYMVSEHDRGQTDALKKGFDRTTGNILGWLCSDDLLVPHAARFVLDYFRSHPEVDFIYGDSHVIGPNGELLKKAKEIPFNWFIWKYDHNYIPQPSAFWKRTLYNEVGGLDESFELAMDSDLFARFAARHEPQHVRCLLSKARWYPQQKTQRLRHKSVAEHRRISLRYSSNPHWGPKVYAFGALAKMYRVGWKLTTGCYR